VALPVITSISPSPITAGTFTITVSGAGFIPGSIVSFDGAPLTTTVVSSTTLTATGTAPGAKTSVPVVVQCPDGETSAAMFVNVTAALPVGIAVSPTSAVVRVKQTRQFTATITNTSNKSAIWKVNGIVGGNAAVGRISTTGLYRAPNAVPSPATVTVSATAAADSTKSASASVTVTRH
jgi:hypothetical protein